MYCPNCRTYWRRSKQAAGWSAGILEVEKKKEEMQKLLALANDGGMTLSRWYVVCTGCGCEITIIYSYENWRAEAFNHLLYAAWSCDDCQDLENADYCRKMALLFFDGILHVHPEDPDKWHVVKADIMRRAGMFEYVLGEYQFARYREKTLNRIIAFQLKKAALGDRKCYTEEDALEGQYGFLSCNY